VSELCLAVETACDPAGTKVPPQLARPSGDVVIALCWTAAKSVNREIVDGPKKAQVSCQQAEEKIQGCYWKKASSRQEAKA
jgi:hypothetical protein